MRHQNESAADFQVRLEVRLDHRGQRRKSVRQEHHIDFHVLFGLATLNNVWLNHCVHGPLVLLPVFGGIC